MKIETLNIADIRASSFNPRITLEKGSREYEAIADSIREFGFVEPLVVNSHNMCCLGGHQRLSVLKDMGVESVECVMVEEPDQAREKALCVALNRIKGEWDMDMLAALLQDEAVFSLPTGFEEGEVDLERMLERSIPDYRSMRSLVYEIGEKFITPDTWITDIGCSTGLAIEPFYEKHADENKYFLCDNSAAMLEECRSKFSVGIGAGFVKCVNGNFFEVEMPLANSLVLSILSMQFMPTSYRQKMLNDIYDHMLYGGALVFVEKVVADGGADDLLVDLYYEMKRRNGYTIEKIVEKRKSLENVLSPLKPGWNVEMLHNAGFKVVDMFWRCLNFCGWIAIK